MTAWDVVIVGAGPAGAALACRLRPHCRVLLLDRDASCGSALPRIGESLPGAARVLLQRFGVFDRFLADAHAERGATVSQWTARSDDDAPVWFDPLRDPNGPGWHLDRTRFDAGLREAAVAAGAELIDDCTRLQVSRSGDAWRIDLDARGVHPQQTHCAPVVVDASGRSAVLVRQLGLSRRADDPLVCLYVHLQTAADDEDHCTRLCVDRNGWWYSVRVPSGRRVLAFHLDADDPEMKMLRAPEQLLAKARRQPLFVDVLADVLADVQGDAAAMPVSTSSTGTIVHARPAGSAVIDFAAMDRLPPGFFAIGDAVIAFDPIASQGIFHALASAESAAVAIEALLAEVASVEAPLVEAALAAPKLARASASRGRYREEMQTVHARYREHLQGTYADAVRYRDAPFWARRAHGMA